MKKLFIILLLFIATNSVAQTPFHFEAGVSGSPTDVTPATTGWTDMSFAIVGRILSSPTKLRTTIATTTIAINNSSSTATTCFYRGVSQALVAQTISGTVTGYFRLRVSNTSGCTAQSRIKITVVNRAGVVVATLLAMTSGASNLTNSLTSYQVANAAALSSYDCADGDRIVIEIGIGRSAGTTARNGDVSFGSSSATNITAAGSTAANNPVITFSGNIQFYQGG